MAAGQDKALQPTGRRHSGRKLHQTCSHLLQLLLACLGSGHLALSTTGKGEGREPLGKDRILQTEGTNSSSPQRHQMATTSCRQGDVPGKGADVGSLGACNGKLCVCTSIGTAVVEEIKKLKSVYEYLAAFKFDFLAFPRKIACSSAINMKG